VLLFWCCSRLATVLIGHDRTRHYQPLSSAGCRSSKRTLFERVVRSDEITVDELTPANALWA
jgi:hypothetical protein